MQRVWTRTAELVWGYGHVRFFREKVSSRTAFCVWRYDSLSPALTSRFPDHIHEHGRACRDLVCGQKLAACWCTRHWRSRSFPHLKKPSHTHTRIYCLNLWTSTAGCYPKKIWQKVWKPSEKWSGGMKTLKFLPKGYENPELFRGLHPSFSCSHR